LTPHTNPEGAVTLRILLVEDHVLVAQGLETMLATTDEFEVVGVVDSAVQGVHRATTEVVDVVIMDVNLGRTINGLEATRRIKGTSPRTKVLILTMFTDAETVSEAIRSGADGYLTKGTSREAVFQALRDVAASKAVLDPNVTSSVFGRIAENDPDALTNRELAVLQQISYGKSTRSIGEMLGLADETIRAHVKQIFKKLGVNDRTEAATEGLRRGLIH
jgi:DNA-binding NarL/FixJ family response regulator